MSQILLGGRKIEENQISKKPHRELSMNCLLLLGVWNEMRKECGMNQGSTVGNTDWEIREDRV